MKGLPTLQSRVLYQPDSLDEMLKVPLALQEREMQTREFLSKLNLSADVNQGDSAKANEIVGGFRSKIDEQLSSLTKEGINPNTIDSVYNLQQEYQSLANPGSLLNKMQETKKNADEYEKFILTSPQYKDYNPNTIQQFLQAERAKQSFDKDGKYIGFQRPDVPVYVDTNQKIKEFLDFAKGSNVDVKTLGMTIMGNSQTGNAYEGLLKETTKTNNPNVTEALNALKAEFDVNSNTTKSYALDKFGTINQDTLLAAQDELTRRAVGLADALRTNVRDVDFSPMNPKSALNAGLGNEEQERMPVLIPQLTASVFSDYSKIKEGIGKYEKLIEQGSTLDNVQMRDYVTLKEESNRQEAITQSYLMSNEYRNSIKPVYEQNKIEGIKENDFVNAAYILNERLENVYNDYNLKAQSLEKPLWLAAFEILTDTNLGKGEEIENIKKELALEGIDIKDNKDLEKLFRFTGETKQKTTEAIHQLRTTALLTQNEFIVGNDPDVKAKVEKDVNSMTTTLFGANSDANSFAFGIKGKSSADPENIEKYQLYAQLAADGKLQFEKFIDDDKGGAIRYKIPKGAKLNKNGEIEIPTNNQHDFVELFPTTDQGQKALNGIITGVYPTLSAGGEKRMKIRGGDEYKADTDIDRVLVQNKFVKGFRMETDNGTFTTNGDTDNHASFLKDDIKLINNIASQHGLDKLYKIQSNYVNFAKTQLKDGKEGYSIKIGDNAENAKLGTLNDLLNVLEGSSNEDFALLGEKLSYVGYQYQKGQSVDEFRKANSKSGNKPLVIGNQIDAFKLAPIIEQSKKKVETKSNTLPTESRILNELKKPEQEGFKTEPYLDTTGNVTIGAGLKLTNKTNEGLVPNPYIQNIFNGFGYDVNKVISGEQKIEAMDFDSIHKVVVKDKIKDTKEVVGESLYENLKSSQKDSLVKITYNLGASGFSNFQNALNALKQNDFQTFVLEMKNSKWYNQIGERRANLLLAPFE